MKNKGKAFAKEARSATQFDEEWLAPVEFRRALKAIFKAGELQGEDEDRLVLLSDKNASGAVRWRPFVQGLSPFDEAELGLPESPTRRGGAPSPPATVMEDTMNQTWRRPKEQNGGTAPPPQPPPRATVPKTKPQVAEAAPEEADDKAESGGCLCFGGKKKKYKA